LIRALGPSVHRATGAQGQWDTEALGPGGLAMVVLKQWFR